MKVGTPSTRKPKVSARSSSGVSRGPETIKDTRQMDAVNRKKSKISQKFVWVSYHVRKFEEGSGAMILKDTSKWW